MKFSFKDDLFPLFTLHNYHAPASSDEVKNAWSYTSIPQYVFTSWCLVKHRDNFTFIWD